MESNVRAVKSSPGPEWGTTCKGEIPPGLELNGFFFGFPRHTLDDMACASSGPHGTRTQQGFGVIECPVRRGSYDRERLEDKRIWIDLSDAPMLRLRVAKKPSPLLNVGLALLRPQLLTKWQSL
mgnify:FL=1